jgi:hypothetical protein
MLNAPGATLSVTELFARRDEPRPRDMAAEEQLHRCKEEEFADYRHRLDNFCLTDEIIQSGLDRIRRACERGETELTIASFPSVFCNDGGRAIINASAPPINEPSREEAYKRVDEPQLLTTMPAGVRQVHDFWKANLKPGGFGVFFSWPKNALPT